MCAAAVTACGGGSDDEGLALAAEAREPTAQVLGWTAGVTACDQATGRVLNVGPGQAYAKPSAAAAAAQSGDVIRIAKGDYHGDVATWTDNDLTICGVGGRARLFAAGKSAQGKAIWVVSGHNITIDSVEFHQAKVKDKNGAGIRAEHTGKLIVRNSGFYDNQTGILGAKGAAEVEIEASEFARSGHGDGYSHNLYIGNTARLTVRSSYFHEAKVGHNLKSRAAVNIIENSYFLDGPGGASSYQVDFPDGGDVLLRGNMFYKSPKAQNPTAISYMAERSSWSTNRLVLRHNTVVMTRPGGYFVRAPGSTSSVVFTGNVFAGTQNPGLIFGFPLAQVVQKGNVITQASFFPGAANTAAPDFWPVSSLLPALALGEVLDPQYLKDAPGPYQARAVAGSARLSGALQAPRSGGPVVDVPPAPPATPPQTPPVVIRPAPPATPPQSPPVIIRPAPPVTPPQSPPVVIRPTPPATPPQTPPVVIRPAPQTPPVVTRPDRSGDSARQTRGA